MHLRTFPQATVPFMRFQVGETISRPARVPIYSTDGGEHAKLTGHEINQREEVQVFQLRGFGRTEDEARKRAQEAVLAAN